MKLDHLIGKSIIDVIPELPKFDWVLKDGFIKQPVRLQNLIFVYYEREKPKTTEDLYYHLDVMKKVSKKDLEFIAVEKKRLMGMISMAQIYDPYQTKFAHIPMIDFDTDENFKFLNDRELIDLIKKKTKEETELGSGIIMKSGPKRNYHLIGVGELLSDNDLLTFLGLCLTMRHKNPEKKTLTLSDSRHVGHALSAMRYISELNDEDKDAPEFKIGNKIYSMKPSRYTIRTRFSTLRITPKEGYRDYPTVVDVF